MRPLTLRGRILLGFSLPLALVVVAWAVLYGSLVVSVGAARSILDAEQRIGAAHALARSVVQAESSVLGYLLTGDPDRLDAFERRVDAFRPAATRLELLLRATESRSVLVRTMSGLFEKWRREVAVPAIELRRGAPPGSKEEGSAAARIRVLLAAGPKGGIVADLLAVVTEFERVERTFIERQERSALAAVRVGRAVALAGPVVALAFALWGMLSSSVSIARAVGAVGRAAQGLARGDLSQRVPVERDDEVGTLARAFNTMAARLERRGREQALLREMGDLLHSCRTTQEAFEVAPRLIESLFPGSHGAILLLNADQALLETAAAWGQRGTVPGPESLAAAEGCWALRRGKSHVSRPDGSTPVCAHLAATLREPALCIPLAAQVETFGVLTIGGDESGAVFGREAGAESPQGLAEIVAERLALAVANLRLQETLREQSVRDPLTGLFNRRYMEETLGRELHHAGRLGTELSLVLLDVDHFKSYNDRYGHEAGDALLQELGGWLASKMRQGDVACRYGGEEFVLIFSGASLDRTLARMESLREAVKLLRVEQRGQVLASATLSMGLAAYPRHGTTPKSLLGAADAALYRAKAGGRDRVEVAE